MMLHTLEQSETVVLSPSELTKDEHGALLCYPGTDLSSFDNRVRQLREIGVKELRLEGSTKIGRFGIVGKGCVSIVVKARLETERGEVALKIRRTDANRVDTRRDYELQQIANSFGVGPRAIDATSDFFAMEYIDSIKLGRWFQTLKSRTSKRFTRALIRNTLEQCFLLDSNGLDHGELSNPTKHVLIRNKGKNPSTVIIDYESASTNRRASNVTAVAQFFLLSGRQSEKIRKILGLQDKRSNFSKKKLIKLLANYKEKKTEPTFEKVLSFAGC